MADLSKLQMLAARVDIAQSLLRSLEAEFGQEALRLVNAGADLEPINEVAVPLGFLYLESDREV